MGFELVTSLEHFGTIYNLRFISLLYITQDHKWDMEV